MSRDGPVSLTRVEMFNLRHILLSLTLCLALAPKAAAHDEWTKMDTVYESVIVASDIIDWHQTRKIAATPTMWENNPILGHHPTTSQVDRYFAASIINNIAIAYLLPKDLRHAYQAMSFSLEVYCVGKNVQIGIGMTF